MKFSQLMQKKWGEGALVALLFTIVSGMIMIVFSPWGAGLIHSRIDDYLAKIGMSSLLLVAALLVRMNRRFEKGASEAKQLTPAVVLRDISRIIWQIGTPASGPKCIGA